MRTWQIPPLLLALLALVRCSAAVDIEPVQKLIREGKAAEAMAMIEQELQQRPGHPKLLYDYGVAAYAAGQYDRALLTFDKVVAARHPELVAKARKQKGNAEFHLGLEAQASNLDETIARWKVSLTEYRQVLKRAPEDPLAKTNHDIVLKLLLELLLKNARHHLGQAHQSGQSAGQKMDELRGAMEKFQAALGVQPQNAEAGQGEKQAREELARTLAEAGTRQAQPNPSQPLAQQTGQMEKGINQLEDAHSLLPGDKPIAQQLDQAKEKIADLLTQEANQNLQQARQSPKEREKTQHLDRARRGAERALDQKPGHTAARQALKEASEELAAIHEKKGDEQARKAEHAPLEQSVQRLDDALGEYKDAQEFQPQDAHLRAKAGKTAVQLEAALRKLAEKFRPDPPKVAGKPPESLEQKAARLESLQHMLQDLDELKPAKPTQKELAEVEQKLASVRQQLAEPEPPEQATTPPRAQTSPLTLPELPRMPTKPQPKIAEFKSDELAKKLRDY